MNLGGNVVALDGGGSYTQNKENGQKTRIKHEEGQCVLCLWLPAKHEEVQGETEKVLEGNRFAILAAESERVFSRPVGGLQVRIKTNNKVRKIKEEMQWRRNSRERSGKTHRRPLIERGEEKSEKNQHEQRQERRR